jgi:hypothetical protein
MVKDINLDSGIDSEELSEVLEGLLGETLVTTAISEDRVILEFSNGVKLFYDISSSFLL